jgi:transcriptional regulator with XRE-family HTH domain
VTGHALRRLRRRRTVVVYAAASTRARYRRPPSRQDSTLRLPLRPAWGFTGLELHGERLRAGLSQGELAVLMGATQGTVSKWEADAIVPPPEVLATLAVAFGREDWEAGPPPDARPACRRPLPVRRALRGDRLPPRSRGPLPPAALP